MTLLAAYLEDFGPAAPTSDVLPISDERLETERLEAFDTGYRAGWDDAIKAKNEDNAHLTNGVAQSLQTLSFTYHEVHAQVLSNLIPLFDEILNKLLPSLARDTLGAHVADQLGKIARELGQVEVLIVVAPGLGPQVSQLVNATAGSLPISVTESAAISEGQAEIRLGAKELSIDLSDMTAQITSAVQAVFYQSTEAKANE